MQIDSLQLDNYNDALKTEIENSVCVEQCVLTLQAVAEQNDPTRITILEIYSNMNAYLAHLQKPHFKIFNHTTKDIVKSLELVEMVPVARAMKPE